MNSKELNEIVMAMRVIHQDNPNLDADTLIEWVADSWTGDIEDNVWEWTQPNNPVLKAAHEIVRQADQYRQGTTMNRTAARGRMPKEYFRGFNMSDMVEFDLPGTDAVAHGKIIDFDKGADEADAIISVKLVMDPSGEWVPYHDRDEFVSVPVSELSRATETLRERQRNIAAVRRGKDNQMRPRFLSNARRAALNAAGREMAKLQELYDAGKIDADEFESRMEELEAKQRHSYVVRRALQRRARIEPADVMLLQNAVKQLGRVKDADEAIRMLRDIIDAAGEMKAELER